MQDVINVYISIPLEVYFLMFLGIALLIAEAFIPGFGVTGILGIVCLALATFIRSKSLADILVLGGTGLIICTVFLIIFFKSAENGLLWRSPIVLKDITSKEKGFVSTDDLSNMIGAIGKSKTMLRPSGVGIFLGKYIDVVTQGEYIEKDTRIIITKVEGRRVVVSKYTDSFD